MFPDPEILTGPAHEAVCFRSTFSPSLATITRASLSPTGSGPSNSRLAMLSNSLVRCLSDERDHLIYSRRELEYEVTRLLSQNSYLCIMILNHYPIMSASLGNFCRIDISKWFKQIWHCKFCTATALEQSAQIYYLWYIMMAFDKEGGKYSNWSYYNNQSFVFLLSEIVDHIHLENLTSPRNKPPFHKHQTSKTSYVPQSKANRRRSLLFGVIQ